MTKNQPSAHHWPWLWTCLTHSLSLYITRFDLHALFHQTQPLHDVEVVKFANRGKWWQLGFECLNFTSAWVWLFQVMWERICAMEVSLEQKHDIYIKAGCSFKLTSATRVGSLILIGFQFIALLIGTIHPSTILHSDVYWIQWY